MLRVIKQNIYGFKYPLYASLTLSFASFGDAFLYPFLPQYANVMQIPVVWIGVMLSVNRFIRIIFNPVVIRLIATYGVKPVTIVASMLAVVSTTGYGLDWGLFSLIIFRIIWGMAFAVLRVSTVAYAFENEYVATSLGLGKSIQEAGPMLALWLGPVLLNYFSASNTFLLLALSSIPSVLYAISLPDLKYKQANEYKVKFSLPSLFNSMTFITSFIVEGVLIIVTGLFLTRNYPSMSTLGITSLAASCLAFRRVCSILFAPLIGILADRIGFMKIFRFSLLMIIAGLALLVAEWVVAGLLTVFSFNSISSAMAPGGASNNQTDKIKAVSVNATWRDIGAASGTLIGGTLLSGRFLIETFLIAIFISVVMLIFYFRQTNKT